MKHTPGPWKVVVERTEPFMTIHRVFAADRALVATVYQGTTKGTGDLRLAAELSNAQLISAAPELLEALENLVVWAEYMKQRNRAPRMDEPNSGALNAAKELLRKLGGTP